MTGAHLFRRVALIGVGHIGSSLARAIAKHRLAGSIVGCAKTEQTRAKAMELGLVERMSADPREAVEGADLVVLCTPLGAYGDLAASFGPVLEPGTIVSDVGSAKQCVIRDVGPHLPEHVHLVPGHPVAGTEHSGPESGSAELFEGRWCILTPSPEVPEEAVERVAELWRRSGMSVERMDAQHHDYILAITSHVPHVIAYTIVGTAEELGQVTSSEVMKFSAGGFRDFTRIAASDPTMWRDVFLANKDAVLEMLGTFNEDLSKLTRAIRRGDGEALFDHFARTRAIRRGIVELGQDSAAPDFGRPHPSLPPLLRPYAEE